jgi:hypothetical protein
MIFMISLMNVLDNLNSIYPSGKPYSVRKFAIEMGMSDPISVRDLIIESQRFSKPNPYKTFLGPYFNDEAPNRTIWYTGRSFLSLPDSKIAEITNVKNVCDYLMRLSICDARGDILAGPVLLEPNESTGEFNTHNADADWGAYGPESGTFTGKYLKLKIEISWKISD